MKFRNLYNKVVAVKHGFMKKGRIMAKWKIRSIRIFEECDYKLSKQFILYLNSFI